MLASDVIQYAYREANLRAIGFTPTANETTEGLYRLNALINALFGFELGQPLNDWSLPTDVKTASQDYNYQYQGYPGNVNTWNQPGIPFNDGNDISAAPPINSRLLCRITTATTVYLPQFPADGARMAFIDNGMSANLTLDANGRKIDSSLTKVLAPGAATQTWFYRADLAQWQTIAALTSSDQTPLPVEFDDLFVTGLAIRLAALDEQAPKDGTVLAYNQILKKAKARYYQPNTQMYSGQNVPNTQQSYNGYYRVGNSW